MGNEQNAVKVTMNFGRVELVLMVVLGVVLGVLAYLCCSCGSTSGTPCRIPLLFAFLAAFTISCVVVHKLFDSGTRLAEKTVDALVELEKIKHESSTPQKDDARTPSFEVEIQGVFFCKGGKPNPQEDSSSSGGNGS